MSKRYDFNFQINVAGGVAATILKFKCLKKWQDLKRVFNFSRSHLEPVTF
jgi:homoserine trans-succinylase